jgi:hypothetical protein
MFCFMYTTCTCTISRIHNQLLRMLAHEQHTFMNVLAHKANKLTQAQVSAGKHCIPATAPARASRAYAPMNCTGSLVRNLHTHTHTHTHTQTHTHTHTAYALKNCTDDRCASSIKRTCYRPLLHSLPSRRTALHPNPFASPADGNRGAK